MMGKVEKSLINTFNGPYTYIAMEARTKVENALFAVVCI